MASSWYISEYKLSNMKRTENLTTDLIKQFDKELRAILMYDLKQFKASQGKFLGNNQGKNQDKDLLVA